MSHNITRLLTGTIGGTYTSYEELGGDARTFTVDGSLYYSLSPDTQAYFRTDYVTRNSSQRLQALSPFTGDLQDFRVTIGFSHTL
jgi:predicted porin